MNRKNALIAVLALALLAGCAHRYESLDRAKKNYESAAADPEVAKNAPVALHEARQSLTAAEKAARERGAAREVDHLSYLAEKKVEIARNQSSQKRNEEELGRINQDRQSILIDARTREARDANARAAELENRAKTAEAQSAQSSQKLADIQRQLDDMKAAETEFGTQVTLKDMMFETGKAELTPGGVRNVEKLAGIINKNPGQEVLIEGHTDSTGSAALNQRLSERRAETVKGLLTQGGVPADKVTTRGYGKNFPVASNGNSAGRQQNRRVEVTILNEGKSGKDVERKSGNM